MNPNDAVSLSLLAGELMLSNGAETYRVEDTMRRIMTSCGFQNSEAFVVSTGLFASVVGESGPTSSLVRITKRTVDVDKLIQVNDVSRHFAEGRLTFEEVQSKLANIRTSPPTMNYPFVKLFAAGLTCGGFAYLFGGNFADCLNAFLTGFVLQVLLLQLKKSRVSDVLMHIIGGIMISFLTLTIMNLGVGKNLDFVIIGSLMLLVPGVALTGAVRDVLEGDYLSGSARLLDALTVALAIACGVGTTLKLWLHIFGDVFI